MIIGLSASKLFAPIRTKWSGSEYMSTSFTVWEKQHAQMGVKRHSLNVIITLDLLFLMCLIEL